MIHQIESGLLRLEVPLPENPLISINCYLIKSRERFLLIDTGMNRRECLEEIQRDLEREGVDPGNTDFFITHFHADHIGLISKLSRPESRIYFNKVELGRVRRQDFWTLGHRSCVATGFPEGEIKHLADEHPSSHYGPRKDTVFNLCSDGDHLKVGEHMLTCIETPGHSPGHLCLYDEGNKILFSGDHLLGDITPNISALGVLDNEDPLKDYLRSLDKTFKLDIDLILPGHGRPFKGHRRRTQEIRKHHEARLEEVVSVLSRFPALTPYETASKMSWEIEGRWTDYPVAQKWFATSEALAHLIFLRNRAIVDGEIRGGVWHYYCKPVS